jgi:hypothetical protein
VIRRRVPRGMSRSDFGDPKGKSRIIMFVKNCGQARFSGVSGVGMKTSQNRRTIMKIAAVVCNVVVSLIVFVILVTEGIPKQTVHIAFTVLSALIPILSAAVILRSGVSDGWLGVQGKTKTPRRLSVVSNLASRRSAVRLAAVICNVVLLGFVCWAAVRQYPYPEGDEVIVFALLMMLAPILSLVAICSRAGWQSCDSG